MPAHLIHGMDGTPPYRCYMAIKQRCTNPNHKRYADWGGRGIKVCDRWMQGFTYFWADMGASYEEGLTIERRDNDKGYSPENCYWAPMRDQARNRRSNVWVELSDGQRMVLADAAKLYHLPQNVVYNRMGKGWPDERLLERLWIGSRSPPKFDPARACKVLR